MATSEKQIKEKEDCINQINESLKDIKSQRNALQQTLDAEQKQAQMQQEKLTSEISALMTALKRLEEQNRDISHQLASSEAAAKQELERLWTEVSEKRNLESKFTEQSHKLEELQILLSLNKENAGDTITLQQLKEENRTARLRITETEIKLIEYQQQIQTLEQHIEKSKNRCHTVEIERDKMQTTIIKIRDENEQTINGLRRDIKQLQALQQKNCCIVL